MKRFLFLLGSLFFGFAAYSQLTQLPSGCSDCVNAIDLGDSIFTYGPTTPARGSGKVMDISDDDDESLFYFYVEHNSVWYRFMSPATTQLTFEIIPVDVANDIDFIMFKADGGNTCERITSKQLKPLRTNISKVNTIGNKGATGLSLTAKKNFVHSGPGDAYSKAVATKKGEVYYLAIDHFREGKGHTLKINYKNFTNDAKATDSTEVIKQHPARKALNITIKDAETGEELNANIEVLGAKRNQPLIAKDTHIFSMELKEYRSYMIRCERKGYLYYTKRIVIGDKPENMNLEIKLQPIKAGTKITIKDIYFKGDEAEMLPTSNNALDILEKFLKENENVKIEIQGHVNARKNNKRAQQLSKERAEAVFYHLVLKDIPRQRMKPKGYSNTQMIYPEPESEIQSAANRRVEIRIVSKD